VCVAPSLRCGRRMEDRSRPALLVGAEDAADGCLRCESRWMKCCEISASILISPGGSEKGYRSALSRFQGYPRCRRFFPSRAPSGSKPYLNKEVQ